MNQQQLVLKALSPPIPPMFKVVITPCPHCHQAIMQDSVVFAISSPYHCLLHASCLPFFDYKKGYPHEKPFQMYWDT